MPRVLDNKPPEPMTDHRLRVAAHMREAKLLENIARSLMENPHKFDAQNEFLERHTRQLEAVEEAYKEVQQEISDLREAIDGLYMIMLESQTEEVGNGRWYERYFRKIRSSDRRDPSP